MAVYGGGNTLVDLIALGAVIHVDDIRLGQGTHGRLQGVVGDGVEPFFRLGVGTQGAVELLGIGNTPENVAVHGHVLLIGGQNFRRGDVIEHGGLGEVLHIVDEGNLKMQAGFANSVDDLSKTEGTGVLVFFHHVEGRRGNNHQCQNDNRQNHIFLHSRHLLTYSPQGFPAAAAYPQRNRHRC